MLKESRNTFCPVFRGLPIELNHAGPRRNIVYIEKNITLHNMMWSLNQPDYQNKSFFQNTIYLFQQYIHTYLHRWIKMFQNIISFFLR